MSRPLSALESTDPPSGGTAIGAIAEECPLRNEIRPSDRDAIRSIVESTKFFRADEVDVAVELFDERLARGPSSGYHFVFAELADVVSGYACFGPIPCTIASYDLYWIAVDPHVQRHGIGRRLMAAVQLQIAAAGGQRIYIDTSGRTQYAPTRAFYERNGFHCQARLTDFYAPGDHRLIYVKHLTSQNVCSAHAENLRY